MSRAQIKSLIDQVVREGLNPYAELGVRVDITDRDLKLAGYDDTSPQISRGQRWLATHQRDDGGWGTVHSGQSGADKGEAMWAVLGLVSVDVMSISVAGLNDGQRLDASAALTI